MTHLITEFAKKFRHLVLDVIELYGPRLLTTAYEGAFVPLWQQFSGEHFSLDLEQEIDDFYMSRIRQFLRSFVWLSEQSGFRIFDQESQLPRYLVLIDPLDTTELACRALAGYTHASVFDLTRGVPVVSIVGDFFHSARIYMAMSLDSIQRAEVQLQDGRTFPLRCSKHESLSNTWLTAVTTKFGSRYDQLYRQRHLISAMSGQVQDSAKVKSRILIDFGSIGLCHIAAGLTDAMIEVAKGFTIWDLVPGQHILETAGGFVADPDGNALGYNFDMSSPEAVTRLVSGARRKFIAAGTWELIDQLRSAIILDCADNCPQINRKKC